MTTARRRTRLAATIGAALSVATVGFLAAADNPIHAIIMAAVAALLGYVAGIQTALPDNQN